MTVEERYRLKVQVDKKTSQFKNAVSSSPGSNKLALAMLTSFHQDLYFFALSTTGHFLYFMQTDEVETSIHYSAFHTWLNLVRPDCE